MDRVTLFSVIAWATALINATAGALALTIVTRRHLAKRWTRGRLVTVSAGVLAAAACLLFVQAVLALVGGGGFGLILWLYLSIALVPPALAFSLIGLAWKRARSAQSTVVLYGLVLVLFVPPAVCAYASFIAPFQLVLERARVVLPESAPAGSVRIGVFSDLQTDRVTDYEIGAIERLLAEKPDIILLPGDYFQVSSKQRRARRGEFEAFLNRIRVPNGSFGVLGNVDPPNETANLFSDSPVRLLINQIETVAVNGIRIAIGGVELNYGSNAARRTILELRNADADVRLLVSHMPDVALMIEPDDRIDLVIAGHTHGGQVVVPGFGPLITLTRVPRNVAAGGLHQVGGQNVYVSRGVGHERGLAPPVRLFCPPEITILTLSNARDGQ